MSTIYTIYLARNTINQKCYVGFDSCWPARQQRHRLSYSTGNSKFYNALRKHGWEKFEWTALYQSTDGEHCLNTMENHFISEYDSFHNGYNMTEGGEGVIGYKHSAERIEKIRQKSIGRIVSAKTREKMSELRKGEKHPNFNKPMTYEQKQKISTTLKGNIPWNKGTIGLQKSPNRKSVTINGITYASKLEAMTLLNLSLYLLNKLVNSSGG